MTSENQIEPHVFALKFMQHYISCEYLKSQTKSKTEIKLTTYNIQITLHESRLACAQRFTNQNVRNLSILDRISSPSFVRKRNQN